MVILALFACACGDGGSDAHGVAPTPTPRAGSLDAAFGDAGVTTTDFAGRGDLVHAIAIQPDGRIVVAGQSLPPDGRAAFAAARYLPDGTLDPSFGDRGRVLTPPPAAAFTSASAVALDSGGRVLIAGISTGSPTSSWYVVRYTPGGDVDESFGAGGVVSVPDAAGSRVSLVLEPDGAILVAGTRYHPDAEIAVARFRDDGELDDSFGAGGIAEVAAGASVLGDLALGPNRTIVVGGVARVLVDGFAPVAILVGRLRADGTLDPSFGDGGKVVTPIGPELGNLFALAVDGDGAVIAVGCHGRRPGHAQGFFGTLVVARYDAAGDPVPTFGEAGLVATDVAVGDDAAVAIESSGAFFVGDRTSAGEPFAAARVRHLDANGALDPTFGDGGSFVRHLRADDESSFRALALGPDGRLLAAGFSRLTLGDYDFALARLWR